MSFLDPLAQLFRSPKKTLLKKLGLYRPPSDYYEKQKDKASYWRKTSLNVYIGEQNYDTLKDAVLEWIPTLKECGIQVSIIPHGDSRHADIIVRMSDTVRKGDVCHTSKHPKEARQILWAECHIAKSEKGKRSKQTALHVVGHAWGLEHDGADDDSVMHSPNYSDAISSHDRNTLKLIYANRPKEVV